MASLTETAVVMRKTIRYSIYLTIFIIIARMTYTVGMKIYRRYKPEPPPPPTLSFGKLPKLPFPSRPAYDGLKLTLETPEGELPTMPTLGTVYFMPSTTSDINSLTRAKQLATSLSFNPEGRELSDTLLFFQNPTNPAQTMQMNIVTKVFSINYTLANDPNLSLGNPPTPESAIKHAQSFGGKAGMTQSDIKGPTETELLKVENNQFVRAIALSEADMVKVDLFRKNYNELPGLPPERFTANIWFIVGRAKQGNALKTLAGEYRYYPLDETQSGTYTIKSSQQAWEEITTGRGFIANFGENQNPGEIKIRRVYLAYYDAGIYVPFYQPIIVFDGDNNFSAYVPAVIDEYYGAETTNFKPQ